MAKKSDQMLDLLSKRENMADFKNDLEQNGVDEALVNQHLNSDSDNVAFDEITKNWDNLFASSIDWELPSTEEALALLENLDREFASKQIEELNEAALREVMYKIVAPFGIGSYLAKFDKDGGNVDTVHNVREDVYATEKERNIYENREKYDGDALHSDHAYRILRKKHVNDPNLKDSYTDKNFETKLDKNGKDKAVFAFDHIKSGKEISDDQGRVLAEMTTNEVANQDVNLTPIDPKINSHKNADSMEKYINSNKPTAKMLSEEDKERMRAKDKQARAKIDSDINKKYYGSKKFRDNLANTSVHDAAKMGAQQAIGVFVTELVVETIYEIKEWLKTRRDESKTFFEELLRRIGEVFKRVAKKWELFWKTFWEGAFSGAISNLVTVLINTFLTTSKNVVRIIREGILVLFRAVKLLLNPPKNMTKEQVYDAALKMITSGLISIVGITITIALQASPFSSMPFADLIIGIIGGLVTGILSACSLYALNNLDIFGVKAQEKHEFIMKALNRDQEDIAKEKETIITDLCGAVLST